LGTIVILLGIIVTHWLASFRDKNNILAAESNELISAFAPAIARIESAIKHVGHQDSPEVNEFLKENFELHSAAVKKFSLRITSKRRRKAFKKAWENYCVLEPNGGCVSLFAGRCSPEGKYLELIKEKIENILNFAK
ncbi:MAG: hypothetical protein ABIJ24_03665, partial [Nitrospinota bacterium]